jgi:hypothetical protein
VTELFLLLWLQSFSPQFIQQVLHCHRTPPPHTHTHDLPLPWGTRPICFSHTPISFSTTSSSCCPATHHNPLQPPSHTPHPLIWPPPTCGKRPPVLAPRLPKCLLPLAAAASLHAAPAAYPPPPSRKTHLFTPPSTTSPTTPRSSDYLREAPLLLRPHTDSVFQSLQQLLPRHTQHHCVIYHGQDRDQVPVGERASCMNSIRPAGPKHGWWGGRGLLALHQRLAEL